MGNDGIAWDLMGVNGFLRNPQGRNGNAPEEPLACCSAPKNMRPRGQKRETEPNPAKPRDLSTKSGAAFGFIDLIEAWPEPCGVRATTL